MKLLISAAEASSDAHGARLVRELRALAQAKGQSFEAFGMAGPQLRAAGVEAVFRAEDFLAMGSTEVLGRLPRLFRALRALVALARERKPDVAVVIDYPEFHMRLARRLKRAGVRTVYYIPPKLWVWREHRVRRLARDFDRVLGILPFERDFYARYAVPFEYVGNPLIDELPLNLTRDEARAKLGLAPNARVVVLMPGSRPAELSTHLDLFIHAARQAAEKLGSPLEVLIPLSELKASLPVAGLERDSIPGLKLRISRGDAPWALRAADAGIIKSGTSTLEAALMDCPHLVVYRASRLTTWLYFNVVRFAGPVGLSNLVHDGRSGGWKRTDSRLCREVVGDQATPEVLAQELVSLLTTERAAAQRAGFALVRERLRLEGGASPSRKAAERVWELACGPG